MCPWNCGMFYIETSWCIYTSLNWFIIGSDNGLLPAQAITWVNADILSIGPLGRTTNEIQNKIQVVSSHIMHLPSAKYRLLCPKFNVLIWLLHVIPWGYSTSEFDPTKYRLLCPKFNVLIWRLYVIPWGHSTSELDPPLLQCRLLVVSEHSWYQPPGGRSKEAGVGQFGPLALFIPLYCLHYLWCSRKLTSKTLG